jgi:fructose-1,6-bisphosphatase/inositol monophosphatase family enzyme
MPTLNDIKQGRNRARKAWQETLEELRKSGLAAEDSKAMELQWTAIGELFAPIFALKARRCREKKGNPVKKFRPLTLDEKRGKPWEFRKARADELTRQLDGKRAFKVFDFAEVCYHLEPTEKNELLAACIGSVKPLIPKASEHEEADKRLVAIVKALKKAAEHADDQWRMNYGTNARDSGDAVATRCNRLFKIEVEKQFDKAKLPMLPWLSVGDKPDRPKLQDGLVLIVDALAGKRNLARGLPFYAHSIAVAKVISSQQLDPLCGVILVPGVQHMFLGIPGRGAVMIDQRLGEITPLTGKIRCTQDGRISVGVHLSRSASAISRSLVSVHGISKKLPEFVDKEIALGCGPWSLALVAAGALGLYVETNIHPCTAYAGAVILQAAAEPDDRAVTDLDGNPWLQGNPLAKQHGILAWSHHVLRDELKKPGHRSSNTCPTIGGTVKPERTFKK